MEISYTTKGLTDDALGQELDKLWNDELWETSSKLHQDAKHAGIDLSLLSDLTRTQAIDIQRRGEGIGVLATALVVIFAKAFAPKVAKAAQDLWELVLLPRIVREKGRNTIVEKQKR